MIDIDETREILRSCATCSASAALEILDELEATRGRVAELETRLQIDPGGSDKIDELEEVIQYVRAERDEARAAEREARALLADQRARDIRVMAHQFWILDKSFKDSVECAAENYDNLAAIEVPPAKEAKHG